MSKATLKTKVKNLANELESAGFVQDGPFRLKRSLEHIDQFVELQPGHEWLEGKFTCNLCWKITAGVQLVEGVYDYCVRIGFLVGETDLWFSHETRDELASSYEQVASILREKGLPYLDSISDLKRMVELYESASTGTSLPPDVPTNPLSYFGMDEGWKHYNLGFAYKVLGISEKANEHFAVVVDQHSREPFDWVQDRRQACEKALSH